MTDPDIDAIAARLRTHADAGIWAFLSQYESRAILADRERLQALVAEARGAVEAYRELGVCYRINKPPSERLFKQLKKADDWLARTAPKPKEQNDA